MLTVGVLVFEWDLVELILVYLSEIVAVAVLFAVASLFAAQPAEGHDASTRRSAPNPVRPVSALPPVYPRNIGSVAENVGTYAVFLIVLAGLFVSIVDRGVSALLSPTAGLTVLEICVSQLIRVWREFFVDHSCRDRSPADALELGRRPTARVIIIALYVVVPTTVVVVMAAFAVPDTVSGNSILLMYLLPIGAARVWLRGDAVESVVHHQD